MILFLEHFLFIFFFFSPSLSLSIGEYFWICFYTLVYWALFYRLRMVHCIFFLFIFFFFSLGVVNSVFCTLYNVQCTR